MKNNTSVEYVTYFLAIANEESITAACEVLYSSYGFKRCWDCPDRRSWTYKQFI